MRKRHTRDLVLCGLFTALIVAGAFIRIDFILPITLQLTFVLLAGMLLGRRNGALCSVVYMLLGLAGLPVFAQGGGFMYVLKPGFGYIIGFIIGAFTTGHLVQKRKNISLMYLYYAGLMGIICIYAMGVLYCIGILSLYIKGGAAQYKAYLTAALAALAVDLLLMIPTSILAKRLLSALKRI